MQALLVTLIVVACTGYAVWALMPGSARRWSANLALRTSWPAFIDKRLRRAASAAGGCSSCGSGCETSAKTKPAQQVVRIHRRTPR